MVSASERLGPRPQFPKVKSYLKSYFLGPSTFETEDTPRLVRYANEGSFTFRYAPELSENLYTSTTASSDLVGVSVAKRWQSIHTALGGNDDWMQSWAESISYAFWASRINCRFHRHALEQFERGERRQKLRMMFLDEMGANIANCIVLGWTDWAINMTQRVHWALDHDLFNDGGDSAHRRTQHFILRLIGRWQDWPERNGPSCAFDEPLFNALLDHWATPNADDLAPLLLAACDRHTHQARPDSNKAYFDMRHSGMDYDPFEVLAVMKLRELHGLPNPVLDHVLMNTPLGRLPAPTAPYSDELLDGVLARARREFPDL